MKTNKEKRISVRVENNDYIIVSKLAREQNTTISKLIRQQIKIMSGSKEE